MTGLSEPDPRNGLSPPANLWRASCSTMATEPEVLLSLHPSNHSATLTLNRPRAGNSITPSLQSLFLSHLSSLAHNPDVHSLIVTGAGKFFCTGMDLSSGGNATAGSAEAAWENGPSSSSVLIDGADLRAGKKLFDEVDHFPKPTIALINGPCYGGGNGLAFACDLRVALSSSTFVLTEVTRGLVPAIISKILFVPSLLPDRPLTQHRLREWPAPIFRLAALTALPLPSSLLLSSGTLISTHPTLASTTAAAHALAAALLFSAPGAMSTIKGLARGGGEKERKEAFVEMMRPSEEAVEGIGRWRRKEKVDWVAFGKRGAKL